MDYSHKLLRITVAQICQQMGWTSIQSVPLAVLTEVLERYILEISRKTHKYSELFGRTQPNLNDLGLAFQDLNVSLSELEDYVHNVDAVPFVYDVPRYPAVIKDSQGAEQQQQQEAGQENGEVESGEHPVVGDMSSNHIDVVAGAEPSISSASVATSGNEKLSSNSLTDQSQAVVKRPRCLPEEAAHSQYEMRSFVRSESGHYHAMAPGRLPQAQPLSSHAELDSPPPYSPLSRSRRSSLDASGHEPRSDSRSSSVGDRKGRSSSKHHHRHHHRSHHHHRHHRHHHHESVKQGVKSSSRGRSPRKSGSGAVGSRKFSKGPRGASSSKSDNHLINQSHDDFPPPSPTSPSTDNLGRLRSYTDTIDAVVRGVMGGGVSSDDEKGGSPPAHSPSLQYLDTSKHSDAVDILSVESPGSGASMSEILEQRKREAEREVLLTETINDVIAQSALDFVPMVSPENVVDVDSVVNEGLSDDEPESHLLAEACAAASGPPTPRLPMDISVDSPTSPRQSINTVDSSPASPRSIANEVVLDDVGSPVGSIPPPTPLPPPTLQEGGAVKQGRGRPKGSKNKLKSGRAEASRKQDIIVERTVAVEDFHDDDRLSEKRASFVVGDDDFIDDDAVDARDITDVSVNVEDSFRVDSPEISSPPPQHEGSLGGESAPEDLPIFSPDNSQSWGSVSPSPPPRSIPSPAPETGRRHSVERVQERKNKEDERGDRKKEKREGQRVVVSPVVELAKSPWHSFDADEDALVKQEEYKKVETMYIGSSGNKFRIKMRDLTENAEDVTEKSKKREEREDRKSKHKRDKEKDRDKERDRDRDKKRDKEWRSESHEIESTRYDREREKERELERSGDGADRKKGDKKETSRSEDRKTNREIERKRDSEREAKRDREIDKGREREREKVRERDRERDRETGRSRDTDRERDREMEKVRERFINKETDRERDTDRGRDKERNRDSGRNKDTDRHSMKESSKIKESSSAQRKRERGEREAAAREEERERERREKEEERKREQERQWELMLQASKKKEEEEKRAREEEREREERMRELERELEEKTQRVLELQRQKVETQSSDDDDQSVVRQILDDYQEKKKKRKKEKREKERSVKRPRLDDDAASLRDEDEDRRHRHHKKHRREEKQAESTTAAASAPLVPKLTLKFGGMGGSSMTVGGTTKREASPPPVPTTMPLRLVIKPFSNPAASSSQDASPSSQRTKKSKKKPAALKPLSIVTRPGLPSPMASTSPSSSSTSSSFLANPNLSTNKSGGKSHLELPTHSATPPPRLYSPTRAEKKSQSRSQSRSLSRSLSSSSVGSSRSLSPPTLFRTPPIDAASTNPVPPLVVSTKRGRGRGSSAGAGRSRAGAGQRAASSLVSAAASLPPLPPTSAALSAGSKRRSVMSETVGKIVSESGEVIWICPQCKMPDDGSPMIGCDECDDWYHWPCVGIHSEPSDDEWFCSNCRGKGDEGPDSFRAAPPLHISPTDLGSGAGARRKSGGGAGRPKKNKR